MTHQALPRALWDPLRDCVSPWALQQLWPQRDARVREFPAPPDILNVRDSGQDRERSVSNLNSALCQENLSPAASDTRLEGHGVTRWCWGTGAGPWWINKQKTRRELSHFKHLFWVTAANCWDSINDSGCEKLPPHLHLRGCLQPEASAAMHLDHAACWVQCPGEDGDEPAGRGWAERVSCGTWLQEKHCLEKFSSDAPVSCTRGLPALPGPGEKAEINGKSWHLLHFDFYLAALRKWFHSHFASSCLSAKGVKLQALLLGWISPWLHGPQEQKRWNKS